MPDRIVRWKASAYLELGWGHFYAEKVSAATHAGRVYKLCRRIEDLRTALAASTDPLVVVALAEDAERNEDELE